jgi:hypothetical protein
MPQGLPRKGPALPRRRWSEAAQATLAMFKKSIFHSPSKVDIGVGAFFKPTLHASLPTQPGSFEHSLLAWERLAQREFDAGSFC